MKELNPTKFAERDMAKHFTQSQLETIAGAIGDTNEGPRRS